MDMVVPILPGLRGAGGGGGSDDGSHEWNWWNWIYKGPGGKEVPVVIQNLTVVDTEDGGATGGGGGGGGASRSRTQMYLLKLDQDITWRRQHGACIGLSWWTWNGCLPI